MSLSPRRRVIMLFLAALFVAPPPPAGKTISCPTLRPFNLLYVWLESRILVPVGTSAVCVCVGGGRRLFLVAVLCRMC